MRDYALKQVSHLSLTDSNYKVAINSLMEEFFNKEFIIDEILKNILKVMLCEEYYPEFWNIKYYLSEIKSYLYELQQYNANFFQEGSSGNILISQMITNKIPKIVEKELINTINNNYPSLEQIFNSYKEVLKTLILNCIWQKKNIKDEKISRGNNKY